MSSRFFPPEWAEQRFVQLTFPHADTDWAYMLDEVNECFVNIAREIVKYEDLLIVCRSERETRELLSGVNTSRMQFVELPSNDAWARDHGAITVFEDGQPLVLDFTFNGWGLKFSANYDNLLTRQLFELGVFEKNTAYRNCLDFVLEGGSLESDGEGTLLTTAECLLSVNRNNQTKEQIEKRLINELGLKRVLWLHHGYLAGDDTDSHIDTLARFCSPHTIAYVKCEDETDEHYKELKAMEGELQAFRTLSGEPYTLVPLPMADAVHDADGQRLPATYANFLIINGAVLVPFYNSPKDKIAQQQIQKAFPDREIIGINCLSLIQQHGSLHCVTMQYPVSSLNCL